MNTKDKLNKLEQETINIIKEKIEDADAIVIGAGAGLSASAGLNYGDSDLFAKYYTPFLKKGYKSIGEGISDNWNLDESNAVTYWGFWANHINNIYYRQPQMETYKLLYDLIKDKSRFIITTNGDGQFFKGNYDEDNIFAMQGSYSLFQCQKNCNDKVYDNEEMIKKMLAGFDSETLEIRKEDIPRCEDSGDLLVPNLRIDSNFVETPHMVNRDKYIEFINTNADKNILFLEFGVGYNTPVIIRFPFEQMTETIENAYLIRVNKYYPELPKSLKDKAVSSTMDIHELLEAIG